MSVRVLMFGWEYPPHQSGGLGVACQGFAEALISAGAEITFVLPQSQKTATPHMRFRFADVPRAVIFDKNTLEWQKQMESSAYLSTGTKTVEGGTVTKISMHEVAPRPMNTLIERLHAYAHYSVPVAIEEDFDIIHAHDWLTYLAGLAAKEATGKPLAVHVHNTIYDRGLGGASDEEKYIERRGITEADAVFTVSNHTKKIVVEKYGVDPGKVFVVHNGVDVSTVSDVGPALKKLKDRGVGIVLCHGRVTLQKGVEYFVDAAARVLQHRPNTVFVISGWGDLVHSMIEKVAVMGLSTNFIFVPVSWAEDRDSLFKAADVLVAPSVSEPFGIVPLESIVAGTPVIISKTTGAGEVIKNCLQVDFWDTDEIANKILAVLEHPQLRDELREGGMRDLKGVTWEKAAAECLGHYTRILDAQI